MKKRTWMICVCMAAVLMFTIHAFQMPFTESASAASKTEESRVLIAYFGRYPVNFDKLVNFCRSNTDYNQGWQPDDERRLL